MSNLKKQQKELLIREMTAKSMEYLMGLSEKNQAAIRQVAEKSSGKLVKLYYQAIKAQHRKALKARKEKKSNSIQIAAPGAGTETILLAS